MAVEQADLIALDALGPKGAYRAQRRQTVADVRGRPVAELSLVPALFVSRAMSALHKVQPLPADERAGSIARAGRLFADATLNGLSPAAYDSAVSRVAGLPISVVRVARRAVAHRVTQAYRSVQQARPAGAAADWRDPLTRSGHAVWVRRGGVFAVHAAGNHPGTHSLWPEALALGYRVAVRPSRREPFTPHRLVTALRAAGFGDDQVVLLPTDHDGVEAMLRSADRAMVYGGDEVIRRYAGSSDVLAQGPGRTKVLVGAGAGDRAPLDTIVESIAGHGGTGCVNTTAVFVEGDPAPVASAIAARLSAFPSLAPEDEQAVLPVQPVEVARGLETYLLGAAGGAQAWLGGDGIVDELGDGSAVLRPAVHHLSRADAPQTGVELPFPCVWVAPWSPDDGIDAFKQTLVLSAFTRDERLVDDLLGEPSISNLYLGDHPTHWIEPGIPHDDYLAEFLMRSKAVIRD
jgi:acyl-CoA reductase-like NAD-dependent aldehyde dehydrogenase